MGKRERETQTDRKAKRGTERQKLSLSFRKVTSRRKEGTYRRSKNKNDLSTCQSAPAS